MGLFATGKLKIWNVAIVQLRPQFADSRCQIRTTLRQKLSKHPHIKLSKFYIKLLFNFYYTLCKQILQYFGLN